MAPRPWKDAGACTMCNAPIWLNDPRWYDLRELPKEPDTCAACWLSALTIRGGM